MLRSAAKSQQLSTGSQMSKREINHNESSRINGRPPCHLSRQLLAKSSMDSGDARHGHDIFILLIVDDDDPR